LRLEFSSWIPQEEAVMMMMMMMMMMMRDGLENCGAEFR
jgi:hypothetical protein